MPRRQVVCPGALAANDWGHEGTQKYVMMNNTLSNTTAVYVYT